MNDRKKESAASPEEAKRQLYERQCALLDTFLKKGAISRAQYERSLGDLTEKMGCGTASAADGAGEE